MRSQNETTGKNEITGKKGKKNGDDGQNDGVYDE